MSLTGYGRLQWIYFILLNDDFDPVSMDDNYG
jgi:hypothetical protein